MKKRLINFAIIGCGRVAGHHCRNIVKMDNARLVAVCDLDFKKAINYEKTYNAKAYINYREMLLMHPEIDVVAIITPSGMHYEHSIEILNKFNKSLIVEKPTFMKSSEITRIYKLANLKSLNIFPVFQNRFNKAVKRVKKGIMKNELGKIKMISVRVRWCRPQRYYDLAPWRGTFALDGGCLTNQGIHHIDLMRYFAGEVDRVNAKMMTLGSNIEVEDSVVASLLFKNKILGNLEITTAARPIDYEASISIVGDKGLAQIGGIAVNELQIYTPNPKECKKNSEDFSQDVYGKGHNEIYKQILNFYKKGKKFSVSQKDAFNTIQLLNALYVSDETQKWINVKKSKDSKRLGKKNVNLSKLYRI